MHDRNDSGWIPSGPQWVASAGTSAVQLAWGTWRVSIARVPPTDADLTRTYDRASARWSSVSTLLGYSRAYPELFTQLQTDGWLDQMGREAWVLDCGTGTGALIRALPADLAGGLHVHGVDRSSGMLARAAFELGRLSRAVELHRADVRRLPFPNDRVDLVMSAHMLEHLPDPLEGLREMIRVLRPGGTLLLVTTRPSVPEEYLRLTWRYRTFDPEWLLHALGACGLTRPRCYSVGRRRRLARWLSLAYTGMKPSEAGPMPAAPSLLPAVGVGARPGRVDRPESHPTPLPAYAGRTSPGS
jgi:demethylmenaquinone methyltransferase/2-methoxy-6-polyprenyl-1,4-benzoquinol methylase